MKNPFLPSRLLSMSVPKILVRLIVFLSGFVLFEESLIENAQKLHKQKQQNPCPLNVDQTNYYKPEPKPILQQLCSGLSESQKKTPTAGASFCFFHMTKQTGRNSRTFISAFPATAHPKCCQPQSSPAASLTRRRRKIANISSCVSLPPGHNLVFIDSF